MQAITNFFSGGAQDGVVSIFLAKVLGIYLILMSLWLIVQGDRVKAIAKNFQDNPGLQMVSAFLALAIGLLVVIGHNIWVFDWPVLITVLGWLALVKGVIRLFYAKAEIHMSDLLLRGNFHYVWGIIWLIIGLFLAWEGFFG